MTELEAKLLVPDAATLEALACVTRIGDAVVQHPRSHTQHDTYLDTPSLRLARAGYGCRLRRKGAEAVVTLKGLGGVSGAVHAREEIEHDVAEPSVAALLALDAEPGPTVRRLAAGEALQELFHVETHRRTWDAVCGGQVCFELVLDRAVFRVQGGEHVLLEMELESRDGDADRLRAAAAELRERFGLADSTLSKFARGLHWAGISL